MADGVFIAPETVCPGENRCSWFAASKGKTATAEEKREDACTFCPFRHSKPTIQIKRDFSETSSEEIELTVSEIESLIDDEDAGFAIDWNFHDPELYTLVVEWRRAEKAVRRTQAARQQAFIKAHYEKK